MSFPNCSDMLKKLGRLLKDQQSEIALASEIRLNLLLWIYANVVAALKLGLDCRDLPIKINGSSYMPAVGQLYPGTAGTD